MNVIRSHIQLKISSYNFDYFVYMSNEIILFLFTIYLKEKGYFEFFLFESQYWRILKEKDLKKQIIVLF